MKSNHNYTIMPLDERYIEEICQDIKYQYENNIASLALFKMTLVAEGNPVQNKAETFCRIYDKFRDRLAQMGLECGVLVQATIGHGYPLNEKAPFTMYVGRTDGEEKNKYCPYDEGVREHFRDAMRTIASHHPKLIMVDDDFRLMFFYGRGCVCPLHMKRLCELSGQDITREELNQRIAEFGEDDDIVKMYIETQGEALIGAAKAMREGIDSVDETIPGMYCTSGISCEFAPDIAKALAGKNNPIVVRIHNGIYCPDGLKNFTAPLYRTAQQIAFLKDETDVILAENDTCPQNRYAMSARHLHGFLVGTILEGTTGTKRWITKLDNYEAEGGMAYRKILAENCGFYEKLAELSSEMSPVGCCIPLYKKKYYSLDCDDWEKIYDGWSRCVLERLGLPMYFSKEISGAVFLEGDHDKRFSDEEIADMLKGTVFIASDAAKRLIERGFSEYIGVDIADYTEKVMSGEIVDESGNVCQVQKNSKELIPRNDSVKIDSWVYHSCDDKNKEKLFPGVTVYENPVGGTCVVFAGTPVAEYYYTEGFSFLNATRKEQLIRLLAESGNLPIYYPGDAEIYIRAGYLEDGSMMVAMFNLCFDPVEKPELVCEKPVNEILVLASNGNLENCTFEYKNGKIIPDITLETLMPVVLIIK